VERFDREYHEQTNAELETFMEIMRKCTCVFRNILLRNNLFYIKSTLFRFTVNHFWSSVMHSSFLGKHLFLPLLAVIFLSCTSDPTSPYDPSNVKMYLCLKSSTGVISSDTTEDTADNTLKIGIRANLPDEIDSVRIEVQTQTSNGYRDSILPVYTPFTSSSKYSDTAWYAIVFNDTGTKVIKGMAYIQKGYTFTDSITAIIHPKQKQKHPPIWQDSVITLSGSVGKALTLSLSDKCSDADSETLTFSLIAGVPLTDTILGTTYTFTPTSGDTGLFYPQIVAKDPVGLADTVTLYITISAGDTIPPELKLITPASDNISTNAPGYTVTLMCTDSSGIASVIGKLDTASFTGSKVSDSVWSVTISGLTENAFNTIVFTATDNSLRSNKSTLTLHIKYDPTMTDADGPVIKLISGPNSGDTVKNAVVTIVDSITDPSWLDSVYWTLNGKNLKLLTQSGNIYTLADTLKSEGYNILTVTAKDKSSNGNRSTQTIMLYVSAPSITVQPSSQSILSGSSAVFSVVATGTAPLAYQWKKNAVDIPDAIKSSYTIDTVTLSDSGSYTVTVSNSAGTITSQTAILTVNYAPSITTQPLSQTLYLNQTTTFTVVSTGNPVPTYQWYKNGAVITGATNASYTISSPGISDSGKYTVAVMNNVDTVLSDTAKFYAVVTSVSAGDSHGMILKSDGTLWATGSNFYGELGDGTTTNRLSPIQIMNAVSAVSAGNGYTMILKNDSTLWAMGYNVFGQLGDGTTTNRLTPVLIMTGVKTVSAGDTHTMIVKNDGTLWGTGTNGSGQLGDGTTTDKSSPVQVLNGVSAVDAGGSHTMILKTDGTLWATGYNASGQLGDGTTTDKKIPFQVTNEVAAVSTGFSYTVVLKTNGTLLAMGENSFGQLGDGSITNSAIPVQVMTGVLIANAGARQTMIVKTDRTLWALGCNDDGELGDGTKITQHLPEEIKINDISGGVSSASSGTYHSMMVTTSGQLWTTGDNRFGQLGDGTTTGSLIPKLIIP
jgi:alpha-tubulin suppressor-like RCC1 family protein